MNGLSTALKEKEKWKKVPSTRIFRWFFFPTLYIFFLSARSVEDMRVDENKKRPFELN
jgi:hypothetical protein